MLGRRVRAAPPRPRARALLALTVVALVPSAGCGDAPTTPAPTTALPVVAELEVTAPGVAPEVATGFVVGDGLVLTVAHALTPGAEVAVRIGGRQPTDGRVVATDPSLDAAVVAVDGAVGTLVAAEPEPGPARILLRRAADDRQPAAVKLLRRIQVSVRATGKPQGTTPRRAGMELGFTARPGDSGSPVIDPSGAVVGMVFGTASDQSITYATAMSALQPLVAQAARAR